MLVANTQRLQIEATSRQNNQFYQKRTLRDSELKLEEFEYSQLKDKYKDKTLKELDISKITGATVVGVKYHEQGFLFGPKHDTQIGQKDVLILLGSEDSLHRFKDYLN